VIAAVAAAAAGCATRPAGEPTLAALLEAHRALPESPADSTAYDRSFHRIVAAARPLVALEQSARVFPSEDVAFCRSGLPEEEWTCSGHLFVYADDTVHVAESPPVSVIVLDPVLPVRLRARPGAVLLKAALLDHDRTRPLRVGADGTVDLSSADLAHVTVLAAFYVEPGLGIRKHAWVVQGVERFRGESRRE
jgi:hypothetical protein